MVIVSRSVPCVFLDIPLAALQVLMKLLPPRSHVNLRQVSQAIFKRITQRVSLQLSRDSSFKQVQQWHKLAQRLDEITSIDVCINGQVTADAFELAMQLLSKRTTPVSELHLLAGPGGGSYAYDKYPTAYLTTLRPLQHLAHQLRTLEIKGIATHDLAVNLGQLASAAAAGGWSNLTSLSLYVLQSQLVPTYWAEFFSAIQHLSSGFQALQQLEITVPPLEWHTAATQITPRVQQVQVFDNDVSCTTAYCAKVAIIAELAIAALQLKGLKVIRIAEVPDAWAAKQLAEATAAAAAKSLPHLQPHGCQGSFSRKTGSVPRKQSAVSEVLEAGDLIAAYVAAGLLPAASNLATLDDLGRFLLQQHGELQHVHISPKGRRIAMTWQDPQYNSSGRRFLAGLGNAEASAAQRSCCVQVDSFSFKSTALNQESRSPAGINSMLQSISLSDGLVSDIASLLSCYSSRPPSNLLQLIISLSLKLPYDDVDNLTELFSDLRALKRLEIIFKLRKPTVPGDWPNMSAFAVEDAAIQAATTLAGLTYCDVMAEPNPRFCSAYVPCFCNKRKCTCWTLLGLQN